MTGRGEKRKASARMEPTRADAGNRAPVAQRPRDPPLRRQGLLVGIEQCEGGFHDEEITLPRNGRTRVPLCNRFQSLEPFRRNGDGQMEVLAG